MESALTVDDIAKDSALISMVAATRIHQLDAHLHRIFDGTVQAGPFAGLRLIRPAHTHLGLACRLLGTMERQLHPAIEDALARPLAGSISVGASDGFYSLGMLMRRPDMRAILFEADGAYAGTIRANAELNGLAGRIDVRGYGDCAGIGAAIAELGGGRVHLVVDCEGAEKEILDPVRCPGLARAEIVVECHDFVDRTITATLLERFRASHDVTTIEESSRPVSPHPAIAGLPEIDRALAMCELRPEAMRWLWMRPRSG